MSTPPVRWIEKAKWSKTKFTKKEKAVLIVAVVFATIFWLVVTSIIYLVLSNIIPDDPETNPYIHDPSISKNRDS